MSKTKNLKAYRELHGLTQVDIANILDISYVSYSNKETGKKDFKLQEAKKIADLFGSSVDEIFFTNIDNIKFTKLV